MTIEQIKVTRYVCDRCGAADNVPEAIGLDDHDNKWRAISMHVSPIRMAGTRLDLCPRCADDFDRWRSPVTQEPNRN